MSLTNKAAQKIASELNYDKEKSAVIGYGLFAFVQIMISLALVALFGFLLGFVIQALVVSFAISILRQYSGGVHATRPSICLIIGTVITIAIAAISHYTTGLIGVEYLITINVIIFGVSYFFIAKLAPVDSPAKPIRTENKRKKMKTLSLVVLSLYLVFIIVMTSLYLVKKNILFMEYAMCICLAAGWQVFNLTKIGHRVLKKVDSGINKILFETRRKHK